MQGDAEIVEAMARAIWWGVAEQTFGNPKWCDLHDTWREHIKHAARAALAALRQHRPDVAAALDGWRTLDSAPRCGADFLMHYPRHSAINVVSWRGGMWQDADGWRLDDGSARAGGCLWHPLPPPPECAP